MTEEYNIKSVLIRTFCTLMLCLILIVIKFIIKEEVWIEQVYNYLASDIVFLK